MPLHRRHARQHRPERLQRRHFSLQLSVRQRRRASASSSDAKIPSAEAARAAPVSCIALPRVMASLSRAIASSSKEAAPPWSLLVSNANPPFELPQAHLFAETSTTSLRTDRSDWMTDPGMAYVRSLLLLGWGQIQERNHEVPKTLCGPGGLRCADLERRPRRFLRGRGPRRSRDQRHLT
jgi:hypothetical protein